MRHLAEHLSAVESADAAPPLPDLEFLARMLGIQAWESDKRWSGYPLADEVESRLADPIAVARAHRRIGELLDECAAAHSRASVSIQRLN